MISDSVEKVETGSRLVNDAGVSMNEIVVQVKRVTDLIAEITTAALEQSSGIGQVNEAVTQMDQVTQQNVALVEQSAAAAAGLKQQAEDLAQALAVFKIGGSQARELISKAQASDKARAMRPKTGKRAAGSTAQADRTRAAAAASQPQNNGAWEEF